MRAFEIFMYKHNQKLKRIKFWKAGQKAFQWNGANGQPAPSVEDMFCRPEWMEKQWIEGKYNKDGIFEANE